MTNRSQIGYRDAVGRPRGFDETDVIRSAARLFAERSYDGVSVDDLVAHLGVHRNSLYKTFGSKRGLYLAALRWSLTHDVASLAEHLGAATSIEALWPALADPAAARRGLDLLLLAAVERAPVDREVAREVKRAFAALDEAARRVTAGAAQQDGERAPLAAAITAAMLGLRIRGRAGATRTEIHRAAAALARRFTHE